MSRVIKAMALALAATAAMSGSALAATDYIKNLSVSYDNSVLSNPPALVFVPKNGKYEVKKEGAYSVKLRLKAERRLTARIIKWRLEESNAGGLIADSGFSDTDLKKLDKTFTYKIGWQELKPFEAEGRKVCEKYGKPDEKVIKTGFSPRFYFLATVWAKTKNSNTDMEHHAAPLPIRVVCMPEPFEVKDVDLTVQKKGGIQCPKDVTLKAKFTTNKPGKNKITFTLVRGDGAKQEVTINTFGSGQQSIALWHKNYTFAKSEDRKYMIIVKGSPISTDWVPMKVSCNSGGVGGFSAAPNPNVN